MCRYMLVVLNKGVGEKVVMDGSLFAKMTPPSQAFQMESPDFQQMFVGLAQEGAATAGLNWYRYAWSLSICKSLESTSPSKCSFKQSHRLAWAPNIFNWTQVLLWSAYVDVC